MLNQQSNRPVLCATTKRMPETSNPIFRAIAHIPSVNLPLPMESVRIIKALVVSLMLMKSEVNIIGPPSRRQQFQSALMYWRDNGILTYYCYIITHAINNTVWTFIYWSHEIWFKVRFYCQGSFRIENSFLG